MAPEWEKLAKHFAGVDGLVIAEVDCTADGQNTCQSQGLQAGSCAAAEFVLPNCCHSVDLSCL